MARESKLGILIETQNRSKRALSEVENSLGRLNNAAGGLNSVLGSAGIGRLLGGAGLAAGVAGLTTVAIDMARASEESIRFENAFRRTSAQFNIDADGMVATMRRLSGGMIDDTNLMLNASRAMNLGVVRDLEDMQRLMEIARARSDSMGLTVAQAFNDITTGIGRESALILDNLGLTIDLAAAKESYAESIGKLSDELTSAETKQALLNEAYRQTAGEIAAINFDEAGSGFARLSASVENLKDSFGRLFAQDIASGADALASGLDRINAAINPSIEAQIADIRSQIDALLDERARLEAKADGFNLADLFFADGDFESRRIDEINNSLAYLGGELENLVAIGGNTAGTAQDLAFQLGTVEQEAGALGAVAAGAASGVDELSQSMRELLAEISSLQAAGSQAIGRAAAGVVDIVGQERALALVEAQSSEYNRQVDIIKRLNLSTEKEAFLLQQAKTESTAVFEELRKGQQRATAGGQRFFSEQDRGFEQLKSKAASVLSGALSVGVGVNPDDILGRQDAINENARRLADVAVKGFDSPWAEYLRNEFPGLLDQAFEGGADIRQLAATALREFEQGLRPELIDKDLAKERIRAMILGEQNLAALAQEISQELASEMQGINLPQVQAAANRVLGTGDTGQADAEALSGGFVRAVESAEIGAQVAEIIDTQVRAEGNLERVRSAGAESGAAWGAGFLARVGENVPGQLIDILADLVTPAVQAGLSRQATLVGAQ